jgi:hypothetical protein
MEVTVRHVCLDAARVAELEEQRVKGYASKFNGMAAVATATNVAATRP